MVSPGWRHRRSNAGWRRSPGCSIISWPGVRWRGTRCRGVCRRGRVAGSAAALDKVIAGTVVGDLALVSVAFGAATPRLIQGLRGVGWPRVIALVPDADPGQLTAAVHTGASGILRYRAAPPCAGDPLDEIPVASRALSPRESGGDPAGRGRRIQQVDRPPTPSVAVDP